MTNWLDRFTLTIAPRWTMRRVRARAALEVFTRNYEAATVGRRTQGWRRSTGDANASIMQGLARLRDNARDLVRNNPYAESAVATIADHTVGWGIVAKPGKNTPRAEAQRFTTAWKAWAETPACDSEGRLDLAGLQKLVMRSVAESGEVLIRRRWRRPEDKLPLPLQLQILESDYLDERKDGVQTAGQGMIIQGVEYNVLGQRVAYWLFREHPGSNTTGMRSGIGQSVRVPASEILHIFKPGRPGQARGPSWFAPVLLRMKDCDEYEDAALMKQKVAACLAVLTTDVDGTTPPLGGTDPAQPTWDALEPGMIANLPPGRSVTVVDPPSVSEHPAYIQTVLRAIAAGLGVTYEDLVGDYQSLPFSAARMSRLRHWARVDDWRWRMLIPQFCDPVWRWAVEAGRIATIIRDPIEAEWTPPPMPMIEPDKEGLAYMRNVRAGIQTLPEAIRERGYDPEAFMREFQESNKLLDQFGIKLDSDPRYFTQAGQVQSMTPPPATDQTVQQAAEPLLLRTDVNELRADLEAIEEENRRLREAMQWLTRSNGHHPEINITTPPVTMNIQDGAIQTHIETPPVTVEGATVNVAPAAVTIAEGAVQVTPPPAAQITVVRTPAPARKKRSSKDSDAAESE